MHEPHLPMAYWHTIGRGELWKGREGKGGCVAYVSCLSARRAGAPSATTTPPQITPYGWPMAASPPEQRPEHTHTPPCQVRRASTVCALQGGSVRPTAMS